MSTGSKIQWTDDTWNPVVGCTRVSSGCDICYAVKHSHRMAAMGKKKYAGLTVLNNKGDRHFNGTVRTVPEALPAPTRWQRPRMVFVNSMSDLFHENVPFEFVDQVFAVMALSPKHTFQILTKRPGRMEEYLNRGDTIDCINQQIGILGKDYGSREYDALIGGAANPRSWPLPNVWNGASIEDQKTADERILHLLKCPSAVRFLSAEPLLGSVDLRSHLHHVACPDHPSSGTKVASFTCMGCRDRLQWCIVGGESGAGSRPCEIDWIRSIVKQCKDARVPCFVKQVGRLAIVDPLAGCEEPIGTKLPEEGWLKLKHPKGGDPEEWPEDLRVREFPSLVTA